MYESNASGSRVHTNKTSCVSEYEEINKSLDEWYTLAYSKNIFPMGPHLAEKTREIAERLGKHDCKGSNGWLDKRYNIKRLKVNGESGDVQGETVDSWKERLPEIIHGFCHILGMMHMTRKVASGRAWQTLNPLH